MAKISRRFKAALAEGICEGYRALYDVYSDAHQRNTQELDNFFRTHCKVGDKAIQAMILTFRTLCECADFSRLSLEADLSPSPQQINPIVQSNSKIPLPTTINPNLHIDIQIHIDASAKAEQIDQIFASMARHLYDKKTSD